MKNKKIYAAFVAAAMTMSVGLAAFTACGDECEHVFNYKVKIPATCMSVGTEEAECPFCGATDEREIPADENNHGYGEWDIVKPTESETGTATKICSYNTSHVHTVTLPKLTAEGAGYTSSKITSEAGPLNAGERKFVLADEAGDITFTVPIEPLGVNTVKDAVAVAVGEVGQVRYSYGKTSNDRLQSAISEFYYEFGDNYTHTIDNADRYETWYSYDANDKLFGIRRDGITYNFEGGKPTSVLSSSADNSPRQDPSPDARFIKGGRVNLLYSSSTTQAYFGAEDCLNEMYKWKSASVNGDAYEEVDKSGDETVFKFGFGVYNSPYLCMFKIEFTLTETYALKHLLVESYDYDNTWGGKFEYDPATKYYRVIDGAEVSGIELIEFTNTTEAELSPEEAAQKPVNPYPANALQLKSFDLIENSTGKIIGDGEVVTVNADAAKEFRFTNIENIGPDINDITYDPVSVYRRTDDGDVELNYYIGNTGIVGLVSDKTNLMMRSQIAGDLTIVLKSRSGSFEKILNLHVNAIAPSAITPSYHKYGNTGYTWQQTESSNIAATVYVNQPLPFKAVVAKNEINYASSEFTASITTSNASKATLSWASDAHDVMEFKATAAGTYTIRLASALSAQRTCTITVTVNAALQMGDLFGNTDYTGNLRYPSRGQVAVHCDANAGTITVNIGNGSQIEVLHIDSYNPAEGELKTSHYGGAELGFEVTVNEAYDLVLSHPTGFGNSVEEIILVRKV